MVRRCQRMAASTMAHVWRHEAGPQSTAVQGRLTPSAVSHKVSTLPPHRTRRHNETTGAPWAVSGHGAENGPPTTRAGMASHSPEELSLNSSQQLHRLPASCTGRGSYAVLCSLPFIGGSRFSSQPVPAHVVDGLSSTLTPCASPSSLVGSGRPRCDEGRITRPSDESAWAARSEGKSTMYRRPQHAEHVEASGEVTKHAGSNVGMQRALSVEWQLCPGQAVELWVP